MRKFVGIFLLILFLQPDLFGQQGSFKGMITDTLDKKSLQHSVVSLLKAKDSTLKYFTRADSIGHFEFSVIDTGTYLLMISHPYFATYIDRLHIHEGANEFPSLNMFPKDKLLSEVIVRNRKMMGIRGDTLFFTADSFKVREGANVEELLKRIPGIEVDKNGNIKAMGENISTVLVDGEEFFGNDPGIATKNLKANMVDEVQVFDQKSDEEEFTGIRARKRQKTINLTIKEEKKHGYFGNAEAAGGIKDRFSNSGLAAAFKAGMKFAVVGSMSNIGETQERWNPNRQFSGLDDDVDVNVDLGYESSGSSYEYYGASGIPTNWKTAVHFSDKFDDNRQRLNAGYTFNKITSRDASNYSSRNFLEDSSYTNNSNSIGHTSIQQHSFLVNMDIKIDSMNMFKWMIKAGQVTTDRNSESTQSTRDDGGLLVTSSDQLANSINLNKGAKTAIAFMHKFKKRSRTLMVNGEVDLKSNVSNSQNLYQFNYFIKSVFNRRDSTDRNEIWNGNINIYRVKAKYTDLLSKNLYLQVGYEVNFVAANQDVLVYNRNANGKYDLKIDSLSNTNTFNRIEHRPGINLRYQRKMLTFSGGTGLNIAHFLRQDETRETRTTYTYYNLAPNADLIYQPKEGKNFNFSYQGRTRPPSIDQLQPVLRNTNLLYVSVGNPNLKQSFSHSFNLAYYGSNFKKRTNVYASGNFDITSREIVQDIRIDSGISHYRFVNASGVYRGWANASYSVRSEKGGWNLNISPMVSIYQYVSLIGDGKKPESARNVSRQQSFTLQVTGGKSVETYNFSVRPAIIYSTSSGTINSASNFESWTFQGTGSVGVTIFKKWFLSTEVEARYQQKDARFSGNGNTVLWNASLLRGFAKENKFEISLIAKDILNQNTGYYRYGSGSMIAESNNNILQRYFLLKAAWNFSRMGDSKN